MLRSSHLAVFASLSLALAGCSGTPTVVPGTELKAPISDGDLLDADTGALQGHVYSEELIPLPGVLLALRGTEFQDVTDENGFFLFKGVPPGTHTLDVAALGYVAQARVVEIEAARVSTLEITLSGLVSPEAVFTEVLQLTGFLECAMGAVVFVAPCTYGYRSVYGNAFNAGVNLTSIAGAPADLQANNFWLNFTIRPGAEQLIAELVWVPGSAAATTMQLFILCGDFDYVLNECTERHRYGVNTSSSPVRVDVNTADKDEDGDDNMTKGCPDSKFCVTSGQPVWWTNDVAMPFNNPQFAFQQRFDVWDSIFYNGYAPPEYSIVPDA